MGRILTPDDFELNIRELFGLPLPAAKPAALDVSVLEKMYADLRKRHEDSTPEIFKDAVAFVCHPYDWINWHRLFFPNGPPSFTDLFPQTLIHPVYGPQLEQSLSCGVMNMLLIPTTYQALDAMHDGTFWTLLTTFKGQFKILQIERAGGHEQTT
jgi:hypothetical protein